MTVSNPSAPVVFLDVDGVLVTDFSCAPANLDYFEQNHPACVLGPYVFDPACIAAVNQLCVTAQATVVISSDWRHDDTFPATLKQVGLTAPLHEMWRTPRYAGRRYKRENVRTAEILSWLMHNPDVANALPSFVVLDDLTLKQPLKSRQIVTNPFSGFRAEQLEQALAIIAQPVDPNLAIPKTAVGLSLLGRPKPAQHS